MKALLPAAACLLLVACAGPGLPPQAGRGASAVGAPASPVSEGARNRALPMEPGTLPSGIQLPERIVLPAVYRLLLVDGHLALVRETGAREWDGGADSLRVVAGEPGRGDLSYQPALLPQELAAEVAGARERNARMDAALEAVMQRSRELAERATELESQGKRLAELLAASEARVRQLEAEGKAAPRAAPATDLPRDMP
ncbi:MAG TPA: hypothetical protein VII43_05430 [Opitutaceae bacterium]